MCRMLRAARMLCLFLFVQCPCRLHGHAGPRAWTVPLHRAARRPGLCPPFARARAMNFTFRGTARCTALSPARAAAGLSPAWTFPRWKSACCAARRARPRQCGAPPGARHRHAVPVTGHAVFLFHRAPAGRRERHAPLPACSAHALDGSRTHEVAQVSGSWQLGVFAQGGGAVYGIMDQHLARLELATGHETILERNFYLNHNFSLYGLGELDGNIVIPMTEDGLQVFYAMDANGIFTELCRGSYGPGCFHEGKYYYSDTVTGQPVCAGYFHWPGAPFLRRAVRMGRGTHLG